MIAFLIFIIAMFALDYLALQSKGKVLAVIFSVAAFGCSVIAILIMLAPTTTVTTYSPYNVMTTSQSCNCEGIQMVYYPAHNMTTVDLIPNDMVNLATILGYSNSLIQFGFVVLIVGYLFFDRRKNIREKYNR